MASKELKPVAVTSSKSINEKKKASSAAAKSKDKQDSHQFRRQPRARSIENFVVVWLDASINELSADYQNSIIRLRAVVNTIDTFTNIKKCVDFLVDIKDEKVFLIVSGSLGQEVVPMVEPLIQLDSIYIFCSHKAKHEIWVKQFQKVKGVFTSIDPICVLLKTDIKNCNHDMVAISIMSTINLSDSSSDRLDQSFMYSQLLKENLLEIERSTEEKQELIDFCRIQYAGNPTELKIIDEFDHSYHLHSPIWWYTRECFTYSMMNRALRTLDIEVIIKMGFFIRDLHQQIQKLHGKTDGKSNSFTVYRGQAMMKNEFEKMKQSVGGLLSFNNFLSTSTDRKVSLEFARRALQKSYTLGIIFEMQVDLNVSSAPFAFLDTISYFSNQEKEVLFSMNSVFRIGTNEKIEDRLWRVELILTSSNDAQLKSLTEHIREETSGSTGWHRLGRLMITMGAFDQAEKVYQALLHSSLGDDGHAISDLYHQLGFIHKEKGDLETALSYYQKTLEFQETSSTLNNPTIATTYINIGEVYRDKGDHKMALKFYEKALEIQKKNLPPNHSSFAITFSCIGLVHREIGDHSKALNFYEKTLEIQTKTLPVNHPSIATTFNCIGAVYDAMGDYLNALTFYQRALEIQEHSLPQNHPSLAATFNNIGAVYDSMGDCMSALAFYKRTLNIELKSLPSNHPSLAITYNNVAMALEGLEDYESAVEYAQRAVDIGREALGADNAQVQRYESYLSRLRRHL